MADPPPSTTLPQQGRIAAVDYGHVRLGLAITDFEQTIASPYENYTRQNLEQDAAFLRQFVTEETVVGLVVGLPIHMSGEESEKSLEVRRFGHWVGSLTQLPVRYHDERYTSVAAEQILSTGGLSAKKRKQRRDMLAAQLILAAYLESDQFGDELAGPLEG